MCKPAVSDRGTVMTENEQIRQVADWLDKLVDDGLNAQEAAQLERMLAESESAPPRFYVRYLGLSASLCHYAAEDSYAQPATQNVGVVSAATISPPPTFALGNVGRLGDCGRYRDRRGAQRNDRQRRNRRSRRIRGASDRFARLHFGTDGGDP